MEKSSTHICKTIEKILSKSKAKNITRIDLRKKISILLM